MTKQSVLIVEDERAIAESLAYLLSREGFATSLASSLEEARARTMAADVIVLDLMLPDGSGQGLIVEQRALGNAIPIIVLSSRGAEADRVAALDAGADDYVTKPFSPGEVAARIRAVLRRLRAQNAETHAPRLSLHRGRREARYGPTSIELTRVEFDLLAALLDKPDRVWTRSELIAAVWGDGYAITDRTVDSHIKAVRRKLTEAGDTASLIETVRGVGYRVERS